MANQKTCYDAALAEGAGIISCGALLSKMLKVLHHPSLMVNGIDALPKQDFYRGQLLFKSVKRILLVQVAGVGDLVMATPAIRAIRKRFSEAHIALLGDPCSVGIIEGSPDIDEIFLLSRKFLSGKSLLYPPVLSNMIKKAMALRAKHFDMAVNLCNISTLSGACLLYTSPSPRD